MKQRIVLFGAIWLSCCAGTNLSFAAQRPLMVAEHPANILVKGTVVDENGAPIVGSTMPTTIFARYGMIMRLRHRHTM